MIIDELGFVPHSKSGAELLFEVFSQRYERGSTIVTSNLPFDEWTGTFGSERLTGALFDRLTHHVHILEMNGESYRLKHSRQYDTPSLDHRISKPYAIRGESDESLSCSPGNQQHLTEPISFVRAVMRFVCTVLQS